MSWEWDWGSEVDEAMTYGLVGAERVRRRCIAFTTSEAQAALATPGCVGVAVVRSDRAHQLSGSNWTSYTKKLDAGYLDTDLSYTVCGRGA